MLAQRLDQFVLRHVRSPLDPDLLRTIIEVVFRPVFVLSVFAALFRRIHVVIGLRVGDPGRLFL